MQPESEFRQFRSFFERVFSALHHLAFDQCLVLAEAFERHELDLTSPRSTQKLRRLVSKVLNSLASQVHAELEPIGLRKETRHAALPLPQWIGDLRNPCVAEEVKAAPNLKLDPRARIGPVASSSQPLHPDDRVRFNLVAGAFAREWARHRLWAERGPIEVWSHPQSQELDDLADPRQQIEFLTASLQLSEICLRLFSSPTEEDRRVAQTFKKLMSLKADTATWRGKDSVFQPDATFERDGQTVAVFLPTTAQISELEVLVPFLVAMPNLCATRDLGYEIWWPSLCTHDHLEKFPARFG